MAKKALVAPSTHCRNEPQIAIRPTLALPSTGRTRLGQALCTQACVNHWQSAGNWLLRCSSCKSNARTEMFQTECGFACGAERQGAREPLGMGGERQKLVRRLPYVLKNGVRVIGGTVGVAIAIMSASPAESTAATTNPSLPLPLPVQTAAPFRTLHCVLLATRSGGTSVSPEVAS
jgi:hypothetical protein